MLESAQSGGGIARLGCLLAILAAGSLNSQDPVVEPAASDFEVLLAAPSPLLRGEAALALAATRDPAYYPALLEVAQDTQAPARQRGILALALLGAPGTEVFLGRTLREARIGSLERQLAALGLGLLPEEQKVPAIDDLFVKFDGGNRRRQARPLAALLLGLAREPHPSKRTWLRVLLEDDSYRNDGVLVLAMAALKLSPTLEDIKAMARHLRSGNPELQAGALLALADPRIELPSTDLALIAKLARRHARARVRAAALTFLTSHRQLQALDLAPKAIRSKNVHEVMAGMRAALRLGGGTLREALDGRILETREPELQTAMMRVSRGPHSHALLSECLRIAANRSKPYALRVQAAVLVAEAGWKKVCPRLLDLFLEGEEPRTLLRLAPALKAMGIEATARIHPPKTLEDWRLLPARLQTLMAAGDPKARALLPKLLGDPGIEEALKIELVAAWRRNVLPVFGENLLHLVPEGVANLLR